MPSKREEEWCWRETGSDVAQGPFSSKDEAVEDARRSSGKDEVWIGNCAYPDPASTAATAITLDHMLEMMEERAYNDEFAFDDSIFDIKIERSKQAEEALAKALGDWATEFIDPVTSWHSDLEEKVRVNSKADEEKTDA